MAAERKRAVLKTHCELSLFTYFINPHLAWLSEHGCRIQIQKLYLPHAFLQWIHSKHLWRTYLTGLWTARKSILPRHTLDLACRYKMTPQFKNMYSTERKGVLEFRIWELRAWLVWLAKFEHENTSELKRLTIFFFNALNYCDKNYIIPFINKSEVLLSGNQMYLKWLLSNMFFTIENIIKIKFVNIPKNNKTRFSFADCHS